MWEFGYLWVWMGTHVVSLILSLSRPCCSPLFLFHLIYFVVWLWLSLTVTGFCLYCFPFRDFPSFFFFLSAIGFPFPRLLLQIRCLLFISFSLLSRLTEIGFFLLRKQYFYSNSNWIKYCLWFPPFPPDPLFLFLLTPSLMDPQSAIHQGQVYSMLVHVPYLYFLLPTAASFPHPSSWTSSCCPLPPSLPPTLTCPSLLASVPARLAFRTSSFSSSFFPLLLLFTLSLQLRSHISHDGSSSPQPHSPPYISAAPE